MLATSGLSPPVLTCNTASSSETDLELNFFIPINPMSKWSSWHGAPSGRRISARHISARYMSLPQISRLLKTTESLLLKAMGSTHTRVAVGR